MKIFSIILYTVLNIFTKFHPPSTKFARVTGTNTKKRPLSTYILCTMVGSRKPALGWSLIRQRCGPCAVLGSRVSGRNAAPFFLEFTCSFLGRNAGRQTGLSCWGLVSGGLLEKKNFCKEFI